MDLTTEFGRQQAHAAGGKAHRIACLIEEALAADDRERNERVLEILEDLPTVFSHCAEDDLQHAHDELGHQWGMEFEAAPMQELRLLLLALVDKQKQLNHLIEGAKDILKGKA